MANALIHLKLVNITQDREDILYLWIRLFLNHTIFVGFLIYKYPHVHILFSIRMEMLWFLILSGVVLKDNFRKLLLIILTFKIIIMFTEKIFLKIYNSSVIFKTWVTEKKYIIKVNIWFRAILVNIPSLQWIDHKEHLEGYFLNLSCTNVKTKKYQNLSSETFWKAQISTFALHLIGKYYAQENIFLQLVPWNTAF